MTDTDILETIKQIERTKTNELVRICIGDSSMIIGGTLVSLWEIDVLMPIMGAVFVVVGIYVREFCRCR